MKVVAKGGIPYESSFPYDPFGEVSPTICTTKNKITEAGNKYRLQQNVTDSRIITLLQKGPLTISISADNWEYYSSGVFSCSVTARLSHVALLVGYTADYWIVKNQWGRLWG
jgi:C1A family cysteine protease